MKRSKMLLLGAASGLLCALAVFLYLQNVQGEAAQARAEALARFGGEQLEVCVALRDIAPGERIDSSNVAMRLWVAELLPGRAIRSFNDIAGMQVTSSIFTGEVLCEKRFVKEVSGFEAPEGLSVLSVSAKEVQTVGGSLCAGMKVDVYATGTTTVLLAHDVLVVGTSHEEAQGKAFDRAGWVKLALRPEAVQEIIAASQKTDLYFVVPA